MLSNTIATHFVGGCVLLGSYLYFNPLWIMGYFSLSARLKRAITSDDVSYEDVKFRIRELRKIICTPQQIAEANRQKELHFRKLHAYDSFDAHYRRMISNHCSAF